MLHNVPPILSPDILHTLRAMGHGDEIVISDANFPAYSMGCKVHRLDGITATDVLEAVLTLMPLDSFVSDPSQTMQVVDDPDAIPEIVQEFQGIIDRAADHPAPIATLERFAFYERAKTTFAVIQTGESRLYGNIILKKGVIPPR
ncbi:RbsD/FucU family protein [Antarctobacter heliothermus]|uniref:L-fucose mutarotase n=1 Tax=Antarctobacter heliothermus TaxID=74033 RepID=A0A239DPE3_9RHOB|nr:RbsD/FucU family protein [Antarctobacter heliothermus]SNS34197.1 L-fucose mutarotase [Antarctobacter heliothermus]